MKRSYQKVPISKAPGGFLRPSGAFPAFTYMSSIKQKGGNDRTSFQPKANFCKSGAFQLAHRRGVPLPYSLQNGTHDFIYYAGATGSHNPLSHLKSRRVICVKIDLLLIRC